MLTTRAIITNLIMQTVMNRIAMYPVLPLWGLFRFRSEFLSPSSSLAVNVHCVSFSRFFSPAYHYGSATFKLQRFFSFFLSSYSELLSLLFLFEIFSHEQIISFFSSVFLDLILCCNFTLALCSDRNSELC